jgi:hypothetical protein
LPSHDHAAATILYSDLIDKSPIASVPLSVWSSTPESSSLAPLISPSTDVSLDTPNKTPPSSPLSNSVLATTFVQSFKRKSSPILQVQTVSDSQTQTIRSKPIQHHLKRKREPAEKDLIILPVDNSLLTSHILTLATKEASIPHMKTVIAENRPIKRPRLDQDSPSLASSPHPPFHSDPSPFAPNDPLQTIHPDGNPHRPQLVSTPPSNRSMEPLAVLNQETATSFHLTQGLSGSDKSLDRSGNLEGYRRIRQNNQTSPSTRSPGLTTHSPKAKSRSRRQESSSKGIDKQGPTIEDSQPIDEHQLHIDPATPNLDYTSPGGVSSVFSDDALTPYSTSEPSLADDIKSHQKLVNPRRYIGGTYAVNDGVYSP